MSPISSTSSNGFPFHFKKNSRTLWSFTRLHMILTLSISLDHSDAVSLSYLQFLKQTSLRPDLCKCFLFCWGVFSSLHGKTLSYKTLIKDHPATQASPSSPIWIRAPTPSSFSTLLNTFFFSSVDFVYYQLYVLCTYINCMSLWLRCKLHEGWEYFIHCCIPGAWHMLTHSRHTINSCWIYGAVLARCSV